MAPHAERRSWLLAALLALALGACGGGGGHGGTRRAAATHPDAAYGFVLTRKQGGGGRWLYMVYLNDRTHVEVDSWRSDIETGDCVAVTRRSGSVWFERTSPDHCP